MTKPDKILNLATLGQQIAEHRSRGRRIIHCHGVFDLLHPGHFRHLAAAKNMGETLVVTITADLYVGKGPGRPAFNQDLRAESLAALADVDFVAVVDAYSATPAIETIKPDVFVKGLEYSSEDDDPTGRIREERSLVETLGGTVAYTDDLVFSSSQLINAFLPQHSDETHTWIRDFVSNFQISEVVEWLDRLGDVSVLVVGEAILDVYTTCLALGKASKEPVLCMNRQTSVVHAGGALAIARHCAGLGARVTVLTGVNSSDLNFPPVRDLESLGIRLEALPIDPRPTIRKERIIDSNTEARVLELYEMDDEPLNGEASVNLLYRLQSLRPSHSMTLVTDYGHGFLTDDAIARITDGNGFLAVNAHTNAGNQGFNSIQRYARADFATLNGHEARLEARRRHVDFDRYIPQLRSSLQARGVMVTQGARGLDLYLSDGGVCRTPAMAPYVRDRVGAGDAVLAITSMLMYLGAPPPVVGFLGNLVGAWAVSFIGNERALNLGELKKQVIATLK